MSQECEEQFSLAKGTPVCLYPIFSGPFPQLDSVPGSPWTLLALFRGCPVLWHLLFCLIKMLM